MIYRVYLFTHYVAVDDSTFLVFVIIPYMAYTGKEGRKNRAQQPLSRKI
jgi:hypothetical protein